MIMYKIVEVDDANHSIVVRFYSAVVTEAMMATQWDETGKIRRGRTDYNIDLPVPAPVGADLEKLISAHAPVGWLKTQEDIRNPLVDTSLASAAALLGVVGTVLAASVPTPQLTAVIYDVVAAPV